MRFLSGVVIMLCMFDERISTLLLYMRNFIYLLLKSHNFEVFLYYVARLRIKLEILIVEA